MKKIFYLFAFLLITVTTALAQLEPVIIIEEEVASHNTHICSDGEYLFTANGGDNNGVIRMYTLQGDFLARYEIPLDMRSIMYHPKEKSLWVNCADRNVYRIKDLESGTFELVFEGIYEDKNASLAMGHKGKYLYYFSDGELKVFRMKKGNAVVSNVYGGIRCGENYVDGKAAIAVDEDYFYTWDASEKKVFRYDLKNASFVKHFELREGSFGFSLSYANGLIYTAVDGDGGMGYWYGYRFY
jgi:hypothetical protein